MSVRVFGLGGVPIEEAEGVRQALVDAGIEFYESPPGSRGVTRGTQGAAAAAIWIADDAADKARSEIDKFQQNWRRDARAKFSISAPQKPHPWAVPFRLLLIFFGMVIIMQLARVFW